MCRGCPWWEQTCWGRTGSQRCRTGAWRTGTRITDRWWRFQTGKAGWKERVFGLQGYLYDDLQGFDLLVRGPGLLQGLVQLLDAVGVVLLGEVKQLSMRTLHTQKVHPVDSVCSARTQSDVLLRWKPITVMNIADCLANIAAGKTPCVWIHY